MKKAFLGLTAVLGLTVAHGQTTFHKTYGGTGYEEANFIQQTVDKGYIITGATNSFNGGGYYDISLTKIDSMFNIQWMKSYGASYMDDGYCVKQTLDGGYIVTGNSSDTPGDNITLIKTDSNGNIQWSKNIAKGTGYSIHQISNGDYYVMGQGLYMMGVGGIYLAKINSSGNLLWSNTYQMGISSAYGFAGEPTIDGGYIMTGYIDGSPAGSDVALIKTDLSGNVLWSKTYGSSYDFEFGVSVRQNPDSSYMIAGYGLSSIRGIYLIKADAIGNLLWSKNYGDTINGIFGTSLFQTWDGGYLVGGYIDSMFTGYSKMLVSKMDASGNLLWSKTYGDAHPFSYDIASILSINGGYIFLGENSDMYLIKTDSAGNSGCNETNINIPTNIPATVVKSPTVQVTSQSIVNNYTFSIGGGGTQTTLCSTNIYEIQNKNKKIKIFPNPFSSQTTFQVDNLLNNATLTVDNCFDFYD